MCPDPISETIKLKMSFAEVKNCFSLMELMVVLAILAVVGTVTLTAFGKKPTFVVIDDVANNIEAVLIQGSIQSLAQGKPVSVTYSSELKIISVQNSSDNPDSPPAEEKPISKYSSYKVQDDIEVEFSSDLQSDPCFNFFPDGTANGPELVIKYKGHIYSICVSPLTGMVIKNYIAEE